MKIGIVSEYYYPYVGGISEHVHNTFLRLKQSGIETKIITSKMKNLKYKTDIDYSDSIKDILYVSKSYPFYANGGFIRFSSPFGLENKLRKIFDKEKFDLLYIQSPLVPVLPILAAKAASCPIVGTFHTIFRKSLTYKLFNGFCENIMKKINIKIAVSPVCSQVLRNYFNYDFNIIPNGVDINKFSPDIQPIKELKKNNTKNILFVGRFDPHNGLDILIKAFIKVKSQYKNCRLVIVGDGPLYKKYLKLIPSSILSSVHFVGIQHKLKPNYYSSADVFCHPASLHAQSIVCLEAMASGLPIVASNIPGFKWIMKDNAIYFPPNNVDRLAESLLLVLENRSLRINLSHGIRQRALLFNWENVLSKLILNFKYAMLNKVSYCNELNFINEEIWEGNEILANNFSNIESPTILN